MSSKLISKATLSALKAQLRAKNTEGLFKLASNIQTQNPNSLISRFYTAKGLKLVKRYKDAADLLDTIILPFPKLKKIYLEYLDCLNLAKLSSQYEIQALRFLDYHYDVRISLRLARLLLKNKDYKKAYQILKTIINKEKNPYFWQKKLALPLGRVCYNLGSYKDALEYLDPLITDQAIILKALIYSKIAKPNQAALMLESLSNQATKKVIDLKLKLARQTGNLDSEITSLEDIIKYPEDHQLRAKQFYRLGILYYKKRDYLNALNCFTKLQAMKPKHLKLMFLRIDCLEKLGEYQKALNITTKIHEKLPFHKENLKTAIRLAFSLDNEDLAYSYLKTAFLCNLDDFELKLKYAELSLKNLRLKEAKRVLEAILESGEQGGRIYGLLAAVWKLEGNIKVSNYYSALMQKEINKSVA